MLRIETNQNLVDEHVEKVYENIQNRIDKVISDGGLKKKNSLNRMVLTDILDREDIIFLEFIKKETVLKKILKATPLQLLAFIKWINTKYSNGADDTKVLYKCLYNIFVTHGYNKPDNLDKFQFIKNIGLETCPYCNRSYIYTIGRNRKIKPEIDHFYPKSLYPILAISYFNLIPSCPTCNGLGAKSSQDSYALELKNPYEIEADDFKFSFEINNMNMLHPIMDKESIKIFFETQIEEHSRVFGLDLLYAENRDVVLELYLKAKHEYVKEYIDYLYSYEGLEFTDADIYRFITCVYRDDEDLHKRPLSKLIKDISQELGLI